MFSIPNEAAAFHKDQAGVDQRDIEILVAGSFGHGVIQGCDVTAQGSPDLTVAVAVGTVQINGRWCREVAAGNVVIGAAHATLPRFDLICVDKTGAKQNVAGTAAANPVFPAIPADYLVLAAVYVPATDTTIASNQITDKRVVLAPPLISSIGCMYVVTDFLGGAIEQPFIATVSGTGAAVSAVTGDQSKWGTISLATGTTATGFANVNLPAAALRLGGGEAVLRFIIETPTTLSDAINDYEIMLGFGDLTTAGQQTDGVYIRYNDGLNGGKWQFETASNASRTTADTGVTVAISTRYLVEIEINAAGTQATCYINGAQVAQLSATIPTAAGRETGVVARIEKALGTTTKLFSLDKIELVFLPLNLY
jgi:hypothetical protein